MVCMALDPACCWRATQVAPEAHDKFVRDNDLDGGFFISAQSGENVLTTFYKVAASTAGIELTAHELAFTEKVRCVLWGLCCSPRRR